jgi:Recombinase
LPVIRDIQRSGIKSLRGVARALAARGIPTARGGAWTPVQVSAILQRRGDSVRGENDKSSARLKALKPDDANAKE